MTIVYERVIEDGPKMHALVIGCGRFLKLEEEGQRKACFDSAVAMVQFLVDHAEDFVAPIATIDCYLSDPDVDPEHADDSITFREDGQSKTLIVERPLEENVFVACQDWSDRCTPDVDHLFFYGCSHGVTNNDKSALLVLEDVKTSRNNEWQQLLNISTTARSLPAIAKPKRCWIFMDACQEVLDEILTNSDLRGIQPISANAIQIGRHNQQNGSVVMALAASRFGTTTFAPDDGGIAYFTEALLQGLGECCVDFRAGRWRVTGRRVLEVGDIAAAVHGRFQQPINLTGENLPRDYDLLEIAEPELPVQVSSRPTSILTQAKGLSIVNQANPDPPYYHEAPAEITDVLRCKISARAENLRLRILTANDISLENLMEHKTPVIFHEVYDA